MNRLALASACALAAIGLAGCSDNEAAIEENEATTADSATGEAAGGTETAAVTTFPQGSRIVEEEGVTFRIDADGTRVRLGPTDSRILVEEKVRYRVDPDGTRVRIDPDGAAIAVDGGDVEASVDADGPTLEVDTN
jgi:hypothetical protein